MTTITITKEISLWNFEFWAGAKYYAEQLTYDDFVAIAEEINCYQDEIFTETQINDLFWFDNDTIAMWLGYESWDDLEKQRG